jgi:CRP-like cAMP-binding protein
VNSIRDKLASHPVFDNLPPPTLDNIIRYAIYKIYTTGEILVHQGDVWPYLFYVEAGGINAVKESFQGRALIATTLKEDEFFWGLAFFIEDTPMPVLLQAETETRLYLWSRERLLPVILGNGSVAWNLCQIMVRRMQEASGIVEELAFQPVMGRLAGLLLELYGDAEDEFKTRQYTLDEMAARIGTSREMVCRHLYRFAEKGVIEIRRTELRINDRQLLEDHLGKR